MSILSYMNVLGTLAIILQVRQVSPAAFPSYTKLQAYHILSSFEPTEVPFLSLHVTPSLSTLLDITSTVRGLLGPLESGLHPKYACHLKYARHSQ